MSLVIDLPPAQESRLQSEASRRGVSVNDLVAKAVEREYPVLDDASIRALQYIERRIAEAPTDPEETRTAEEDLRSFQRAIDGTRASLGAQPIYGISE